MMSKRHTAFVFVALMLSSSLLGIAAPSNEAPMGSSEADGVFLEDAFVGFSIGEHQEVWNQTPFPSIAVPQGFDFLSVYDYSDVAVLINNNSEASRTIGWAFVTARNISSERVFIFENQSAPTKETINRDQFTTYFAEPFVEMIQNRSNSTDINYLVTTKGIPLRVSGGNNKASFDQEIALVGGSFNSSVGEDGWVNHGYGPLAGGAMEAFSREEQGFYLVTRLTGYTVETALGLIEKANNSLGERGVFALDLATNRNGSGYKFWNDDLYTANTTLNATMGLPTVFEETSTFLTNVSNVMGYASWGSNDGGWSNNKLPNGGFDSSSSTSSSGAQHWEVTLPTLSAGDSFNWSRQNVVTQGGSSALEASVAAECAPEQGVGTSGIFAEFFDNAGVSFNAASMPLLIDRVPDHTRIESAFGFTSSYGAYPGLDNRFSEDWGARFSGLIDVPDAGNWTFFLTSDDGSEMWLDGASLVKNYGSHGMREVSTSVVLDAGLHDFRIEFFQGGGPHGLTLHWEGPNQTKDIVPASAFSIASDAVPSESHLQHHWSFEDSSGSTANDSAQGSANFTLHNMDSSNWRSCIDGGCLWYDGVDDYLEVDVEDWSGNFTISQWVWANASTLPNYASVFAAGTQAGSNASFQHAIFSGEWRLHNNQTHAFGAVSAQNWTHLVTVFDNGLARQYLDGVLVRSTQFPQGSVDKIDSYRLGVNRAGSTYFEGMIDEVMIWNTSLSDGEVTTLNRDIYLDCAAYSGNGQAAASVQQTFSLPSEYQDHAWLVSGHGMRTGDVYGTFELVVEGLDASGAVLSTNISSEKEFGTAWASTTMRFEPHQSAVDLRITIPLNLVATSTDGSVYLDTIKMYPIRPSHDWMNGSIAETAVSTGARSFALGTTYGQSLVADLLDDGASGLKGYVYEPYLTAVGLPSVLMTSYASGYNLAEAHAAANLQSSWMGVTVGDPKMAPYADVFHDISLIDSRLLGNASYGQNTTVQIALANMGMAAANGTLLIQDIQGNVELYNGALTLPEGDAEGSSLLLNISVIPQKTGWMDLRVKYTSSANASERILDNNQLTLRLWVNAPPEIEGVYCDSSTYARGDTFICSVEATDDEAVTSVGLVWTVAENVSNLSSSAWVAQALGTNDGLRWQTSITLPTQLTLGSLVIEAVATDRLNQTATTLVTDVAQVVDAQAQWFGPHVAGVDSAAWSGATALPYAPNAGFVRGQSTALRVCVLDADHDPVVEHPLVTASRGTLSTFTHEAQLDANHHCYNGAIVLAAGDSLAKVSFEVRSSTGALLSSRLVPVTDLAPTVSIELVDAAGDSLERVRGGGGEYLRVAFSDADDPASSVTGDIMIEWPGASQFQLPIDVASIEEPLLIELTSVDSPLESGDLLITINAAGRHGASVNKEAMFTFLLTPPSVIETRLCNADGPVSSLRFGETIGLFAVVDTERPVDILQASMSQLGWSVPIPQLQTDDEMATPPSSCLQSNQSNLSSNQFIVAFRLRLDGSFIDGEGQVMLVVRDLDGLSTSSTMEIDFFHASPFLSAVPIENATAGDRLEPIAYVVDLDGLDDVSCDALVSQNTTVLANVSLEIRPELNDPTNGSMMFSFPTTGALGNTTLEIEYTCRDSWGQTAILSSNISMLPEPPCTDCSGAQNASGDVSPNEAMWPIVLGLVALVLACAVVLGFMLRRKPNGDGPLQWDVEETEPFVEPLQPSSLILHEGSGIPEGWTAEAYNEWLKGPMPEGWSGVQWNDFTAEQLQFFEQDASEVEKD